MRRATTLLLGVLAAAAGLLVGARPAAACSCAGIPSAAQAFASADAVFTGRLLSREVHHPDWPLISSGDPAVHVFAVDEVFKGVVHEEQGVVSADSGASCGLELSGEGPFVVYATGSDGDYRAGLCDGVTTVTPGTESELRTLAGATERAATRSGAAGTDAPGPPTVALAAGGALVLALGGALLMRRRRRAVR
jgi:MYXO-CTERM domain-containing protein